MIDVGELLTDPDFVRTVSRLRPTTTFENEGIASTTYDTEPVVGSVQPAKDADVNLLPDGVRLADLAAFFTAGDVTGGDGSTALPDLLDIDGVRYRVLHVQDFSANGYKRVLAQRIATGEAP